MIWWILFFLFVFCCSFLYFKFIFLIIWPQKYKKKQSVVKKRWKKIRFYEKKAGSCKKSFSLRVKGIFCSFAA